MLSHGWQSSFILPIAHLHLAITIVLNCKRVSAGDPETLYQASGALLKHVEPGGLNCHACRWTAKALRTALVEKMPKRVKSATKRRELASGVLGAAEDQAVCAEGRFPQHPVVVEDDGKSAYVDLDEYRGGKAGALTSVHFKLLETKDQAKSELSRVCLAVTSALSSEIEAHVAAFKGRRVFGAITERWLCARAARICSESEVPASGDDDEDEEL